MPVSSDCHIFTEEMLYSIHVMSSQGFYLHSRLKTLGSIFSKTTLSGDANIVSEATEC